MRCDLQRESSPYDHVASRARYFNLVSDRVTEVSMASRSRNGKTSSRATVEELAEADWVGYGRRCRGVRLRRQVDR